MDKKTYWEKKKEGFGQFWTVMSTILIQNTVSNNLKVQHIFIENRKNAKFCRPFDSPIYMFPALEKQKTGGLWKERGYS